MLVSTVGICISNSTPRYHARCCVRVQLCNLRDIISHTVLSILFQIPLSFLLYYYYFSLGADVIYDPVYQPHLVRVLAILLNPMSLKFCRQHASCKDITPNIKHENYEHNHEHAIDISHSRFKASHNDDSYNLLKEAPVAYISYVIRNIETFNYFMSLGKQAHLDIVDLTDSLKPLNLLCYMQSYNQANVRLLRITGNNIK